MALKRRMVVVGLGSIGRRHARLLQRRTDLQVEWCEESRPAIEVAAHELGTPSVLHSDFPAALATQPDMMVIATPHAMHAAQSIAALGAGIHVLCEKPLSDSLTSAGEMVRAAQSSRATFTVGFQLHFHPAMRRLKDLIAQGFFGSIHHLHCLVGTYITLVNSKSRYQAGLPGALFMDYAHQPDIFHFLLGRAPQGVYSAGGQGGDLPLQSNPNFAAFVCDYEEPLISSTHLNYLQMPDRHDYELVGDQGWASVDMVKGVMRLGRQSDNLETTEQFSTDRDSLYVNEHQAFLDTVDGKRNPESSANDALLSLRVIDAAMKSLLTRKRVALEVAHA